MKIPLIPAGPWQTSEEYWNAPRLEVPLVVLAGVDVRNCVPPQLLGLTTTLFPVIEPVKTTSAAFAGTAQHSNTSGIAARFIPLIMLFLLLFLIGEWLRSAGVEISCGLCDDHLGMIL